VSPRASLITVENKKISCSYQDSNSGHPACSLLLYQTSYCIQQFKIISWLQRSDLTDACNVYNLFQSQPNQDCILSTKKNAYIRGSVANDSSSIHLLPNAMNNKHKVCNIHWAVSLSSIMFISSAQTVTSSYQKQPKRKMLLFLTQSTFCL
jgi:hypothetical protein